MAGLPELIRIAIKGGIEVFLVIFLAYVLWHVVKHILEKVTAGIDKTIAGCDKMIDRLDKHESETDMRSKFVREEHRQMIDTLGRINGYKKN